LHPIYVSVLEHVREVRPAIVIAADDDAIQTSLAGRFEDASQIAEAYVLPIV
jgi:hypothetical protein